MTDDAALLENRLDLPSEVRPSSHGERRACRQNGEESQGPTTNTSDDHRPDSKPRSEQGQAAVTGEARIEYCGGVARGSLWSNNANYLAQCIATACCPLLTSGNLPDPAQTRQTQRSPDRLALGIGTTVPWTEGLHFAPHARATLAIESLLRQANGWSKGWTAIAMEARTTRGKPCHNNTPNGCLSQGRSSPMCGDLQLRRTGTDRPKRTANPEPRTLGFGSGMASRQAPYSTATPADRLRWAPGRNRCARVPCGFAPFGGRRAGKTRFLAFRCATHCSAVMEIDLLGGTTRRWSDPSGRARRKFR